MSHPKEYLQVGVMQITFGSFTGDFFVAAVPEQKKAVAVTGLVLDEKNHDASIEDAKRIAACWNACDGIDTEQLEILGDNDTTLKERYEALQQENRVGNTERDEAQAINAELVIALEDLLKHFTKTPSTLKDSDARCKAHAAIVKAKGGAA